MCWEKKGLFVFRLLLQLLCFTAVENSTRGLDSPLACSYDSTSICCRGKHGLKGDLMEDAVTKGRGQGSRTPYM
jgi:hypothetical protein